jgi:hypothetical protein
MSAHCGASRLCAKHGRRSPKPSLPVAAHFPFRHRHRTRKTNALKISYGQSGYSLSRSAVLRPCMACSRHVRQSRVPVFSTSQKGATCGTVEKSQRVQQNQRASRRQAVALPVDAAATGLATGTTSSFTIGDRVIHDIFCDGTVEALRDHKLHIKFETVGSKEILASFMTRPR